MRALYSFSIIIITIIISIIINLSSSLLCQTMWNQCATKSMEGSEHSDSVFYNGTPGAQRWKRRKNTKTRETKTQITQCFEMVWPILGGTMRKLTSWGFRKCCSFLFLKVLNQSYWLSKLAENGRLHCTNLENSQMLPISSQSLNGHNSASRGAREVPKKRKIIRI